MWKRVRMPQFSLHSQYVIVRILSIALRVSLNLLNSSRHVIDINPLQKPSTFLVNKTKNILPIHAALEYLEQCNKRVIELTKFYVESPKHVGNPTCAIAQIYSTKSTLLIP